MKALVLTAYKQFEYRDAPDPRPGRDEVLIKVAACGICGSDVHGMDGSSGRRIPPLIMGHEAAGVIVEVGREVRGFRVGERVTFDSTVYCGECFFCRRGEMNLCDNRRVLGVSTEEYRRNGAFAEYVVAPERILYRLPKGLPFEHAALVEATSIAVHAVGRPPIHLGDAAVVVGTGMIGLFVVQALRAAGVDRVIAVDIDQTRLDLARKLGATQAIRSDQSDAVAEIRKLTEGRGADLSFEVVGATPTLKTATESVRKGGSVTLVGNLARQADLQLQSVVTRQVTLYGSCASSGEYPICLDMLNRKVIQAEPIISAVAPLQEGGVWFDRLYRREPGLMKVILAPALPVPA
jgi:L-iditol 2-dehydrogenase